MKREYLKYNVNELATNNYNKNINDLHRGSSFRMRMVICLQIPTTF
jgi:hypothetical protein